jgi:hypothetical protein
MAQVRTPDGMYQERKALLDRIQSLESSAGHFMADHVAGGVEAFIACARARLQLLETMISGFEESPVPQDAGRPHGTQRVAERPLRTCCDSRATRPPIARRMASALQGP